MTEPVPPTRDLSEEEEVFAAVVLRYLDDAVTAEEVAALNDSLRSSRRHRTLFVKFCRLHAELGEVYLAAHVAAVERKRQARAQKAAAGVPPAGPACSTLLPGRPPAATPGRPDSTPSPDEAPDPGADDTLFDQVSGADTVHEGRPGQAPQAPDEPAQDLLRLLEMLDQQPEE